MTRHSSAACLMLAFLALLALAGPAAADKQRRHEKQVPFRGRLEGVVTSTPLTPPFISVEIDGAGKATQLGHFTVFNWHLVDTSTATTRGSYEFTAANGDTLTADFSGQATLLPNGLRQVVETATITGGTGRFAGATGSFTVERLFDRAAGTTSGSFTGTISIRGSGEHDDDDDGGHDEDDDGDRDGDDD